VILSLQVGWLGYAANLPEQHSFLDVICNLKVIHKDALVLHKVTVH
jgi:hypothetical protein